MVPVAVVVPLDRVVQVVPAEKLAAVVQVVVVAKPAVVVAVERVAYAEKRDRRDQAVLVDRVESRDLQEVAVPAVKTGHLVAVVLVV